MGIDLREEPAVRISTEKAFPQGAQHVRRAWGRRAGLAHRSAPACCSGTPDVPCGEVREAVKGQDRSGFRAVTPWAAQGGGLVARNDVSGQNGSPKCLKAGGWESVPPASWHGGEPHGAGRGDVSGPGEGSLSLPVKSLLWQQQGGEKSICAPRDSFETIYGKHTRGGCKAVLFPRPSESDDGCPERVGQASAPPTP